MILSKFVKLLTPNCPHKLESRDVLHVADYSGGFKVDHIALVFQPTVEKVEHLFLDATQSI